MKILVIDGQGGRIGKMLIEGLRDIKDKHELVCVGTNSIATTAMLKAGAGFGATGENPVLVNSENADIILGPIGLILANSLHGEISPKMALAVAKSKGHKILIPTNKCNISLVGLEELSLADYINLAIDQALSLLS